MDSKPVGLSLFKETCAIFKPELPQAPPTVRLPTPLRDHYKEGEPLQGTMREEVHKMKMAMTVSHEEINYLEECTRGQSENMVWYQQGVFHQPLPTKCSTQTGMPQHHQSSRL